MSSTVAAAIYGLTVHPGESATPPFRVNDFPATFRITMAAIDPSAQAATNGAVNGDVPLRATLKMIRLPMDDESDDDEDEDEEDYNMAELLDESDSDSDDEDTNGGPSDPEKSPKARKQAMIDNFKSAVNESKEDHEMDGVNGVAKVNKGKGRATDEDESEESDEDLLEPEDVQELVLCTLDPAQVCHDLKVVHIRT